MTERPRIQFWAPPLARPCSGDPSSREPRHPFPPTINIRRGLASRVRIYPGKWAFPSVMIMWRRKHTGVYSAASKKGRRKVPVAFASPVSLGENHDVTATIRCTMVLRRNHCENQDVACNMRSCLLRLSQALHCTGHLSTVNHPS